MKKIFLIFFFFFGIVVFPFSSYAQIPFGAFSRGIIAATCSLPEFLAQLNCAPSFPAPPNVPLYTYQTFSPLFLTSPFPVFGVLAVLKVLKPVFTPACLVLPGFWVEGFGAPPISQPGFYIPGFPATPYTPCFPSWCIPFIPAIGTVTPAVGVGCSI